MGEPEVWGLALLVSETWKAQEASVCPEAAENRLNASVEVQDHWNETIAPVINNTLQKVCEKELAKVFDPWEGSQVIPLFQEISGSSTWWPSVG